MLTLDQHFASGYLPALTGAYFNLVLLLAKHGESSNPDVRAVVRDEIERLRATGAGVKDNVRLVQALADIAGFEPPPPPGSPDAYFAWFTAVYAGFREGAVLHNRGELAHILGHGFGEMLCSWNVAVMVVRLLVADPESPALEQQWASLADDLGDARDTALIHARHPNVPPALAELFDAFDDAVSELLDREPDGTEDGLDALGAWLNETMRDLDAAVTQAREELADEDTAAEA